MASVQQRFSKLPFIQTIVGSIDQETKRHFEPGRFTLSWDEIIDS